MGVLQKCENVSSIISKMKPSNSVLCFDPTKIRQRVSLFQNGFPGDVSWAVKSNPHPNVVQAIIESGIKEFDVASKGEIDQLRYQAPSAKLNFNHPIKPPEEISYAYFCQNIDTFVVDCMEEVQKIAEEFKKALKNDFSDVTLLVRFKDPSAKRSDNYDFGAKFGATPEEAHHLLRHCKEKGFKVGMTFHPGSQNKNAEAYTQLMDTAHNIAVSAFGSAGANIITTLNVGGGFPCYYPDDDALDLSEYFLAVEKGAQNHDCRIICEPGRGLVSDSMSVLTRVNMRRKGRNELYINDGFYGSFMELPFVSFMPPARAYTKDGEPIKTTEKDSEEFLIWGATCDSIDKIPKPVHLPSKIAVGDYIEFGLMGAYTNATDTGFNGIAAADMVEVEELAPWEPE